MKVTVTGATGTIGTRVVAALRARGDDVAVLSRDPGRARSTLGADVEAHAWDPSAGPAPTGALRGRDGVIHLLGESVAQRWDEATKQRIRDSRVVGTRHLVEAIAALPPDDRPRALVSGSASGYYGDAGEREITEASPAAADFLARVCVDWEAAAREAEAGGVRVAVVRTGLLLAPEGGPLALMRRPFALGLGASIGRGRQWVPWVHVEDEVGLLLAALDHPTFGGAVNASPGAVRNRELSKAIGRALRRPVLGMIPAPLVKLVAGEAAMLVLDSCRVTPDVASDLGYAFRHPELDAALRDLLG